MEEKRAKCRSLYTGKADEKPLLAEILSVSERTVHNWLSRIDKDLKEERDRKIAEMWLACYTEEEIAEAVGCSVQPVKDVIGEPDKSAAFQKYLILSEYREPDWSPSCRWPRLPGRGSCLDPAVANCHS